MSVPATRGVSGRDPDERRFRVETPSFTCHVPGCGVVHDGVHEIDGERHISYRCGKHFKEVLHRQKQRRKQFAEEVQLYFEATDDQRAKAYLEFLAEDGQGTPGPDERWLGWSRAWPAFREWRRENAETLDHQAELRHGESQPTLEELF